MRVSVGFGIVASIAIGFIASVFAFHGLLDLRKFSQQIEAAQARVDRMEEINRLLRRQVDVVSSSDSKILEHSLRDLHGYTYPGEIVYLEPSAQLNPSR